MELKLEPSGKKQETLDIVISETEFYQVKSGETLTRAVARGADSNKLVAVIVGLETKPDREYGCKVVLDKQGDKTNYLVSIPMFQLENAKRELSKRMVARRDLSVKELKPLDYVVLTYQK